MMLFPQNIRAEQVRSETNRFDGTQKVTYESRSGECRKIKGDNLVESCQITVANLGETRAFYAHFLTSSKGWNLLYFKDNSKIHWIGTLLDGTTIKGYGQDIATRVGSSGYVMELPWIMVSESDPKWGKLKELTKIEIGIAGEEYEWNLNRKDLLKTFSLLE